MIQFLISNPELLLIVAGLVISGTGYLGTLLARLIKISWARQVIEMAFSHTTAALDGARRVYAARMDAADDDGVVTPEERQSAFRAAKAEFLDLIGLGKLRKAFASLGAGDGAAERFVDKVATRAVNEIEREQGLVSPTNPFAKR